jgi:hypothetical protein
MTWTWTTRGHFDDAQTGAQRSDAEAGRWHTSLTHSHSLTRELIVPEQEELQLPELRDTGWNLAYQTDRRQQQQQSSTL